MEQLTSYKNAPKWFILLTDVVICLASIIISYLLRFDFHIRESHLEQAYVLIAVFLTVRTLSFILGRTYHGIIRYTESRDIQGLFGILALGSLTLLIINIFCWYFEIDFNIPRTVILIDFMVTFFLMVLFRLTVKQVYEQYKHDNKDKRDVVIFGADELAHMVKKALERDAGTKYQVVAFVDAGEGRVGKKIEGVKIIDESNLESVLKKSDIHHITISVQDLNAVKKQQIVDLCLKYNTRIFDVPPAAKWIRGELSFKQIKRVRIEDLLGRKPIVINNESIEGKTKEKHILVTGAAGSIGSELVKQIATFKPARLIILDQAETPLNDLDLTIREKFPYIDIETVITDVTNPKRMDEVFSKYKPNSVYHAAAYKHVPMMELNPLEAVRVNVFGTKLVADLCERHNVETMVLVSTDKAVNPTNIMGASKRIAEIYIQSLNTGAKTSFVTTRFGNVLGSNGSVIPRFRKQIEGGGPITVTHPDVTRFFMTIPEACQLILEAGSMGKGGEIYVFDMGESVKIVDLAKKMIKLSRLELGKDIEITFTGLRPGEKLYEELLNNKENTLPTHHPKIMIGKVREYEFDAINKTYADLHKKLLSNDVDKTVQLMKKIVPEFISKNSRFEVFDQK
ncbi:MAG: FlaA1/EpsC-like NDP-sugar epimerase [Glaciecola sp.]|jgi:FlaA1/EpsC-like NDP-sugar epimerase